MNHADCGRVFSWAWGLAEGYTGAGFSEWITLLNPGDRPARVTIRLIGQRRPSVLINRVEPAHHLDRVSINGMLPHGAVSALVTADRPVVVGRTLAFGGSSGLSTTSAVALDSACTIAASRLASTPARCATRWIMPSRLVAAGPVCGAAEPPPTADARLKIGRSGGRPGFRLPVLTTGLSLLASVEPDGAAPLPKVDVPPPSAPPWTGVGSWPPGGVVAAACAGSVLPWR
jgi:hypothetical protein